MGVRKRKDDPHNKRLDLFLEELQIEKDTRKKIIAHVENLTMDALKGISKPKLRLQKPED